MGRKVEVQIRREKVKDMLLLGTSNVDMGNQVGVSEAQIRRDIKAIAKESRDFMGKVDKAKDIMIEMFNQNKTIFGRMWRKYHSADTTEKVRMQSIKTILETEDRQLKILEKMGMVSPDEAAQGNVTNNQLSVFQILMEIKEEEKSQANKHGPKAIK